MARYTVKYKHQKQGAGDREWTYGSTDLELKGGMESEAIDKLKSQGSIARERHIVILEINKK